MLHESIHLYMHPSLYGTQCISDFHEGITEYFTRKIARQQNLAVEPDIAYHHMAEGIKQFADTLGGDSVFETLYVRGDWAPLRAAVNARTGNRFPQWRCQLTLATSLRNNPEHYERLDRLLHRWDDALIDRLVCSPPDPACN